MSESLLDNALVRKFERYFRKSDGCWLWNGPTTDNGYGLFCHDGDRIRAHRVAYWLYVGSFTQFILHRCDVRLCVNPEHLFEGTKQDNALDMQRKGRGSLDKVRRYGAEHHANTLRLWKNQHRNKAGKFA